MHDFRSAFYLAFLGLISAPALAAGSSNLSVTVEGFGDGKPIPETYALCKPTADGKSAPGENRRPAIAWSGAPEATKSFAILITDPDVPADFSHAGKEGQVVRDGEKRQLFYHWALADIPPGTREIMSDEGDVPPLVGTRAANSLGDYLKDARNYGGPCPPWNDERVHHYSVTVYALSEPTLKLGPKPDADEVAQALKGHVLAEGAAVGTYTLNAALRK